MNDIEFLTSIYLHLCPFALHLTTIQYEEIVSKIGTVYGQTMEMRKKYVTNKKNGIEIERIKDRIKIRIHIYRTFNCM